MSASDKKQQRKSDSTAGLTQRELKERAEAQAAKQKKTAYTVVGVVCAVAAAALLVWNSNFWVKTATAATVDGTDYKVPDLQYYYVQARNNQYSMYQMYSAYGISTGYDPSKGDGEQWYSEADGFGLFPQLFVHLLTSGSRNRMRSPPPGLCPPAGCRSAGSWYPWGRTRTRSGA